MFAWRFLMSIGILLSSTLLSAFTLEDGEYLLWRDNLVSDFDVSGAHNASIGSEGDRAFIALEGNLGKWIEIKPGQRLRLPVERHLQVRCDVNPGNTGAKPPGLRGIQLDVRRRPLTFIAHKKNLSATDLKVASRKKPIIIKGNLYPFYTPGTALTDGPLPLPGPFNHISFFNAEEFAAKKIPGPPFEGFIYNSNWSYPTTLAVWYGDILIREESSLSFTYHDYSPDIFRVFLDGRVAMVFTDQQMQPEVPYKIPVSPGRRRLRIDSYMFAGHWPKLTSEIIERSGETFNVGPLQYMPTSFYSDFLDLGRRTHYLHGVALKIDKDKSDAFRLYIRSTEDAGGAYSLQQSAGSEDLHKKGWYISSPKGGFRYPLTAKSAAFIRWQEKIPRGSRLRLLLRQSDDAKIWDAWREYRNGDRLPQLRLYQQYMVKLQRSSLGESPQIGDIGVYLKPIVEDLSLQRDTFDPSGDNRKTALGKLVCLLKVNIPVFMTMEVTNPGGEKIVKPVNCLSVKPGLRKFSFDGIIDALPLREGDYLYRVIASEAGNPELSVTFDGRFSVRYHLGDCICGGRSVRKR